MTNKVALMEFEGNANIGLFFFVNDKFAILGKQVDDKKKKEIENVLNVPVYTQQILGTELPGVFLAGNNEILLVPTLYGNEMEKIEEICAKHDMKIISVKDNLNTLGNNICVGDEEIIVNSNYSKGFVGVLKKETDKKIIKLEHSEYASAGAVCVYTKGKYYVSQELNEKIVKEFVKKIAGVGSINSGSAFISSGVVANSNGILIGSMSSTIEIQEVVENLEYL
jgi:translation initiation factor 6